MYVHTQACLHTQYKHTRAHTGGRASGSVTFPQLGGAAGGPGGDQDHTRMPFLPAGPGHPSGGRTGPNFAAGVGPAAGGVAGGERGARGNMQFAQQQQQQQQPQHVLSVVPGDDEDDDVLPGTPEEEQPANDRDGPSIIGRDRD